LLSDIGLPFLIAVGVVSFSDACFRSPISFLSCEEELGYSVYYS